jgi:hypothetical protein
MNTWRRKISALSARAGSVLFCFVATFCILPAPAQNITTLIQFTNFWKYDQSGLELGGAWRTNDYDDSAWPIGRGLLGAEPDTPGVYTVHAPISTPLAISSTVTTFYFRTTFEFTGSIAGLSLITSNLVDDGCAIYLNGLPAGGVRAPATYNAATIFGGPSTEGQLDVMTLTNLAALRAGTNLLAVEVHQSGPASTDVMWGMKLLAIQHTLLLITNQPQNQSVPLGDPVTLSVGVSGGPAFYRWLKDGVIQPSSSNTLRIASAQLANAGDYRVIVTNAISAVTSSVATLTVFADLTGPTLLSAFAHKLPFPSNTILVFFSEPVTGTSVANTNNYNLTLLGTTNRIPILRGITSPALGTLLTMDTTDPDWTYGGDYVLTMNGIKDFRGNVIAPNSQIAVAWPHITNVFGLDKEWSYHDSYFLEQTIYDQPWTATSFVPSGLWKRGPGPFCGGALPAPPCLEDCLTSISYQLSPTLFRTTFHWPSEFGSTADLLVNVAFDDGIVLFLNGVEIWRTNAPANPPSISVNSFAASVRGEPACAMSVPIAVTNLLTGENWLAAAVLQAFNSPEQDSAFALALDARVFLGPALPETPPPTLTVSRGGSDSIRLSWTGPGYALESTTNLSLGPASYPLGPWRQITNMANPHTNAISGPQQFFRLKK